MNNKYLKNLIFLMLISSFVLIGCNVDNTLMTDNEISYELYESAQSGIDGEIKFIELKNGKIQAEINLDNTMNGTSMPASIHSKSTLYAEDRIIALDPIDGATGSSVTIFDRSDMGKRITFNDLINMDAHVKVYENMSNTNSVVSEGDIGKNKLTGDRKSYQLQEFIGSDFVGSVFLEKRKSGFTKITVKLDEAQEGVFYPTHIHYNSSAEDGSIWIDLNPIDGNTGVSISDIRTSLLGTEIDFETLVTSSAHIKVHHSIDELGVIIAQCDIGANKLTGVSVAYDIASVVNEDFDGLITFKERVDGSVLASIKIDESLTTSDCRVHIYENSYSEGGTKLVTLNSIDAASGKSETSIRTMDDGSPFTFQMLENINGHLIIYKNIDNVYSIIAHRNIGINA